MARYRVTFRPSNVTVEVDDKDFPYGDHGKPGSLLDVALHHGIRMDHNCGGNCACTTCHVVVRQGEENLSPLEQDEEDRLDTAQGLTLRSRLLDHATQSPPAEGPTSLWRVVFTGTGVSAAPATAVMIEPTRSARKSSRFRLARVTDKRTVPA